jgi:hypothetical protein
MSNYELNLRQKMTSFDEAPTPSFFLHPVEIQSQFEKKQERF